MGYEVPKVEHFATPDGGIVFNVAFDQFLMRQAPVDILDKVTSLIAEDFVKQEDISKLIDRESLSKAITEAIGKAFVDRLLGDK